MPDQTEQSIFNQLKDMGLESKRVEGIRSGDPIMDKLRPGSDLHAYILDKLKERIFASEVEMRRFYARWQVMEMKTQAYVDLSKWEKELKTMNDTGKAPRVVSVVMPYTFSTIATIVTYLIHTFSGRKPMFQIGTYKKETVQGARMMELVLQYNSDHTRLIRQLFQFFHDGELYGLGIMRTRWEKKEALRTVWKKTPRYGLFNLLLGTDKSKVREKRTVYEGNNVASVDPYMFFPDPRVPMAEVNRRGEYVFWRSFEGDHTLKKLEADGVFHYIDSIAEIEGNRIPQESNRGLLSGGNPHPGLRSNQTSLAYQKGYKQIDQGTVDLVPSEWGLGESDEVEKWLFTIGNLNQIIQAEPIEVDHGMHPVVVSEPYTMGYGFGHPGISDYLGPIQDSLSWLINSHMDNVKTVLNNMVIVDPSMVEMQDLKNPGPGKIIRLKAAARGQDVRSALYQMQVSDVTGNHPRDMELFMRLGDSLSSVNDNLRGLQSQGGRKTATEARTSAEAGASRLAAHARLISSQAIVDLAEQMSLNIQQNMEEEFYLQLVGQQGMKYDVHVPDLGKAFNGQGVNIAPEMLVGDFYYPVHDGTLPLDRVAMLDVWKEVFLAVAQDPELRQQFSVSGIFEYLAELGGAKNIEQFKIQMSTASPEQIQQQSQAGNIVPIPTGGQTPGTVPNPGSRMAGGQ